jgi:integrase
LRLLSGAESRTRTGDLLIIGDYLQRLKTKKTVITRKVLTPTTRNKLLGYAKIALNFCANRGLIEKNPLKCFTKVPETPRDRILSPDEVQWILDVMIKRKSYLLWAFRFSLKNPIRRGDLETLTRANFDAFKPWIHFYPSKTKARKQRETCLLFLESDLLQYFKSLPADCDLLFPRVDAKGGVHTLGDFKNHWHAILREAKVSDMHWHDLKHCAIITWMIDSGYTERDLKNLGIQYSVEMIDRYYHRDASKVLAK